MSLFFVELVLNPFKSFGVKFNSRSSFQLGEIIKRLFSFPVLETLKYLIPNRNLFRLFIHTKTLSERVSKMKVLKISGVIVFLVLFCGCASKKVQTEPYDYNGSLTELKRNGVPVWAENPSPHDMVSHTCTSTPIYDFNGYFVRYDVRCY